MPRDEVKDASRENESCRLNKLEEWIKEAGYRWAWFAREIGLSRGYTSTTVSGSTPVSEKFVLSCYRRFPSIPPDVFEEHGYVRDGKYVYKRLELDMAVGA